MKIINALLPLIVIASFSRLIAAPDYYVLSIGIGNYPFWGQRNSLQFGANDAALMHDLFRTRLAVDSAKQMCLTDSRAIKNAIKQYLSFDHSSGYLKRLDIDRFLVLYFSGHGFFDAESQEIYLVPFDGVPGERTSLIRLSELQSEIRKSFSDALIVLDCCFDPLGRSFDNLAYKGTKQTILYKSNLRIISAAPIGMMTYEDPLLSTNWDGSRRTGHGVFTYFLFNRLSNYSLNEVFWDLDEVVGEVSLDISNYYARKKLDPISPQFYRRYENIVYSPLLYIPRSRVKREQITEFEGFSDLILWNVDFGKNWSYVDSFSDILIFKIRYEKVFWLAALDASSGNILWEEYLGDQFLECAIDHEAGQIYLYYPDYYRVIEKSSPLHDEIQKYPFPSRVKIVSRSPKALTIQTEDSLFVFSDIKMSTGFFSYANALLGDNFRLIRGITTGNSSSILLLKYVGDIRRMVDQIFELDDRRYRGDVLLISSSRSDYMLIKNRRDFKSIAVHGDCLYSLTDDGSLRRLQIFDGTWDSSFHISGVQAFSVDEDQDVLYVQTADKTSSVHIGDNSLLWDMERSPREIICDLGDRQLALIRDRSISIVNSMTGELESSYVLPASVLSFHTVSNRMRLARLATNRLLAIAKGTRYLSDNALGYISFFDKSDSSFCMTVLGGYKDTTNQFLEVADYSDNLYQGPSAIVQRLATNRLRILSKDLSFRPEKGGLVFPLKKVVLYNARRIKKVLVNGQLMDFRPSSNDTIAIRGIDRDSRYFTIIAEPNYYPSDYELDVEMEWHSYPISLSFRPAQKAVLNFTSDPPGASVRVEDEERGDTPITVTDINAQSTADVQFSKYGYYSQYWRLYTPSGKRNFHVKLTPNYEELWRPDRGQLSLVYYSNMPILLSAGDSDISPESENFRNLRMSARSGIWAFRMERNFQLKPTSASGRLWGLAGPVSRFGVGMRMEIGGSLDSFMMAWGYNFFFRIYKSWSTYQTGTLRFVGYTKYANKVPPTELGYPSRNILSRGGLGRIHNNLWIKFGVLMQSNQTLLINRRFESNEVKFDELTLQSFRSATLGIHLRLCGPLFLSSEWLYSYSGIYRVHPHSEFTLCLTHTAL